MQELVIRGGRPLEGTVHVNGAKNAALPLMAAALLTQGPTILHGVPRIGDVETMAGVLRGLGLAVDWLGPHTLRLETERPDTAAAPPDLVRQMRGSICVLGPLLARRGAALLPLPGGCVIGRRPIDLHVKGVEALGAEVTVTDTCVEARATRLRGARIRLTGPQGSTALGTANVMMACVLAEGRTVIEGAAREPEVQDLARFLNACGARISGIGSRTITIEGVESLQGAEHTLIPDRLEAGTFLAAAAATRGRVALEGARPDHMRAELAVLRRMGVTVRREEGLLTVCHRRRPLRPAGFVTAPYPGLATDMQPQLTVLLCLADGVSAVREGVYPERFTHMAELERMGAHIVQAADRAAMEGVPALRGAPVHAADLRAGAALVIAALAAEGETCMSGAEHLDRGYEAIETKLRALGADVRRRALSAEEAGLRRSA
jgi:UDP-N-acetylglucosamine 1-carboxyvinyltransferase